MNDNNNRKILISELPQIIPNYKTSELPKDKNTAIWLYDWIMDSIKSGEIKIGDFLPSKNSLSEYLGISVGTVENAIRYLEDKGVLSSKQKVGTFISIGNKCAKKQTSKRDTAIFLIQKYITESGVGFIMPSVAKMSENIKISKNLIRLAYIYLQENNILSKVIEDNKCCLKVVKLPQISSGENSEELTLVNKITADVYEYLKSNFNVGDKIPTRSELAVKFGVSVKTIHDSLKILETKGFLDSRRGKYGTIFINKNEEFFQPQSEHSIFSSTKIDSKYFWEKIEKKIKTLIKDNYQIGSKLPSIHNLAQMFQTSTNTVRQALKSLEKKGCVEFVRGRFGGTFIINLPDDYEQSAYEWIAVSPNLFNQKSNF